MKYAKIPNSVADAAAITISQMFSCASGQWYFRRRSTTRTTSVAIVGMVEEKGRERSYGCSRMGGMGNQRVGECGESGLRRGRPLALTVAVSILTIERALYFWGAAGIQREPLVGCRASPLSPSGSHYVAYSSVLEVRYQCSEGSCPMKCMRAIRGKLSEVETSSSFWPSQRGTCTTFVRRKTSDRR